MASPEQTGAAGGTVARLRTARERLDAKDLPGAVAIYEEVLAAPGGDRPDVLVTISGDLGSTGHMAPLIELIAPRYDVRRHGPATGFNLLQAYLAAREAEAARHLLDLLFSLNRPDLEERLFGFSNAISELMLAETTGGDAIQVPQSGAEPSPQATKVGVVTISKPVWFYGLEPLADRVLPPKPERGGRRVAFAQIALPGAASGGGDDARKSGSELGLLASALPAWFAEMFTFAPGYIPYTAVAFVEREDGGRQPMIFGSEWTTDNLRHLMDTTTGGIDYVFTGALRHHAGDYELVLRLWEMKKFRERKAFSARWTPGNADAELGRLRDQICQFMEWTPYPPGSPGVAYTPVASPRGWLEAIGASLNLFLAEKGLVPKELVPPLTGACEALGRLASDNPIASLTWLTLRRRADTLGLAFPAADPALSSDPLVAEAAHASGHG